MLVNRRHQTIASLWLRYKREPPLHACNFISNIVKIHTISDLSDIVGQPMKHINLSLDVTMLSIHTFFVVVIILLVLTFSVYSCLSTDWVRSKPIIAGETKHCRFFVQMV